MADQRPIGAARQRARGILDAFALGLSRDEQLTVLEFHLDAMRGLKPDQPAAPQRASHCALDGRHDGPCIPKETHS